MEEDSEEQETVDISNEYIQFAVHEIQRVLSRSRKKRRKLIDRIVQYIEHIVIEASNKSEVMQDIAERIDVIAPLFLNALTLLLPLSDLPSDLDSISRTATNFGDSLEDFVSNLSVWCNSGNERPHFFTVTSTFLADLLNLVAENTDSWFYSTVTNSSVAIIIWNWADKESCAEGRLAWSRSVVRTIYSLAKKVVKGGDFTCQYGLIVLIQQWLRWVDSPVGCTFLNTAFSLVDPSIRKWLLDRRNFDFDYCARIFLNALNSCPRGLKLVNSIRCEYVFVGQDEIKPPLHDHLNDFWIDFCFGSRRIHMLCSIPGNGWVDLNIRADQIDSVCVSWLQKDFSRSQSNTQRSDTQISKMSHMAYDSLMFLHIYLKENFDTILKDLAQYYGRNHRSLFIVFKEIGIVERALDRIRLPYHTFGEKCCGRPESLINEIKRQTKVDLSFSQVLNSLTDNLMVKDEPQDHEEQIESQSSRLNVLDTPGGYHPVDADVDENENEIESDSGSWDGRRRPSMMITSTPVPRSFRSKLENIQRTPFKVHKSPKLSTVSPQEDLNNGPGNSESEDEVVHENCKLKQSISRTPIVTAGKSTSRNTRLPDTSFNLESVLVQNSENCIHSGNEIRSSSEVAEVIRKLNSPVKQVEPTTIEVQAVPNAGSADALVEPQFGDTCRRRPGSLINQVKTELRLSQALNSFPESLMMVENEPQDQKELIQPQRSRLHVLETPGGYHPVDADVDENENEIESDSGSWDGRRRPSMMITSTPVPRSFRSKLENIQRTPFKVHKSPKLSTVSPQEDLNNGPGNSESEDEVVHENCKLKQSISRTPIVTAGKSTSRNTRLPDTSFNLESVLVQNSENCIHSGNEIRSSSEVAEVIRKLNSPVKQVEPTTIAVQAVPNAGSADALVEPQFGDTCRRRPGSLINQVKTELRLSQAFNSFPESLMMVENEPQDQKELIQPQRSRLHVLETPGGYYSVHSDSDENKTESDSESWDGRRRPSIFDTSTMTIESCHEDPVPRSCRSKLENYQRTPFKSRNLSTLSPQEDLNNGQGNLGSEDEIVHENCKLKQSISRTPIVTAGKSTSWNTKLPDTPFNLESVIVQNSENYIHSRKPNIPIKQAEPAMRVVQAVLNAESPYPFGEPHFEDTCCRRPESLINQRQVKTKLRLSQTLNSLPESPMDEENKPQDHEELIEPRRSRVHVLETPGGYYPVDSDSDGNENETESDPESWDVRRRPSIMDTSTMTAESCHEDPVPRSFRSKLKNIQRAPFKVRNSPTPSMGSPQEDFNNGPIFISNSESEDEIVQENFKLKPSISRTSTLRVSRLSETSLNPESVFVQNSEIYIHSGTDVRSSNDVTEVIRKVNSPVKQTESLTRVVQAVHNAESAFAVNSDICIYSEDDDLVVLPKTEVTPKRKNIKGLTGGRPKSPKKPRKRKNDTVNARARKVPKALQRTIQNILPIKVLNTVPKVAGRFPCYLNGGNAGPQEEPAAKSIVVDVQSQFVDPYDFERNYDFIKNKKQDKMKTYTRKRKRSSEIRRPTRAAKKTANEDHDSDDSIDVILDKLPSKKPGRKPRGRPVGIKKDGETKEKVKTAKPSKAKVKGPPTERKPRGRPPKVKKVPVIEPDNICNDCNDDVVTWTPTPPRPLILGTSTPSVIKKPDREYLKNDKLRQEDARVEWDIPKESLTGKKPRGRPSKVEKVLEVVPLDDSNDESDLWCFSPSPLMFRTPNRSAIKKSDRSIRKEQEMQENPRAELNICKEQVKGALIEKESRGRPLTVQKCLEVELMDDSNDESVWCFSPSPLMLRTSTPSAIKNPDCRSLGKDKQAMRKDVGAELDLTKKQIKEPPTTGNKSRGRPSKVKKILEMEAQDGTMQVNRDPAENKSRGRPPKVKKVLEIEAQDGTKQVNREPAENKSRGRPSKLPEVEPLKDSNDESDLWESSPIPLMLKTPTPSSIKKPDRQPPNKDKQIMREDTRTEEIDILKKQDIPMDDSDDWFSSPNPLHYDGPDYCDIKSLGQQSYNYEDEALQEGNLSPVQNSVMERTGCQSPSGYSVFIRTPHLSPISIASCFSFAQEVRTSGSLRTSDSESEFKRITRKNTLSNSKAKTTCAKNTALTDDDSEDFLEAYEEENKISPNSGIPSRERKTESSPPTDSKTASAVNLDDTFDWDNY